MQRKFLFNLLLLIGINLLIKPFAIFGIDAEVQNRIGYVDYGIYFSIFNFTYLFNILLDIGITNFNIRNVAQFPILSKRYIGKLISLRLILFFVYTIIVFAIGISIGFKGKQFNILFLLVFNQFLLSFLLFLRSYYSGMLLFGLDAFFSVFDRILLILFCGYFLYWNKDFNFNIYYFILSQTVAYLIALILAFSVLMKKIGFSSLKISKIFSLAIFKQAFPYALLIFTMTIYTRSDAVILERIHPHGDFQTGIYAQAYRILDAVVMFSMLFNTLLFPIFSNLLAKKENFQPILLTSTKLIATLSISVVIVCLFFAPQILHLFYDNLSDTSVVVFKILILAFLPISGIQIFGTLHTAAGNLKFLNLISIFGIVISVGINLILIPYFGAIGTATTAVITNASIVIAQIFYTKRYFSLSINWSVVGRIILFMICLIISTELLALTTNESLIRFLYFGIYSLIFAILFRLIDLREIWLIFKEGK